MFIADAWPTPFARSLLAFWHWLFPFLSFLQKGFLAMYNKKIRLFYA
jgi:hypothetical protein